jgi:hypothetical protein
MANIAGGSFAIGSIQYHVARGRLSGTQQAHGREENRRAGDSSVKARRPGVGVSFDIGSKGGKRLQD